MAAFRTGRVKLTADPEERTEEAEPGTDSYGATGRDVTLLSVTVVALWTLWATVIRPGVAEEGPAVSIAARLAFWVLPAAVYLVRAHGREFWVPLGLHFPYGVRQVVAAIGVLVVVAFILLLGTSTQLHLPMIELAYALFDQAEPRLVAPFFEELVFRGVIVAEALTLARLGASDSNNLRRRYWGAQLWAAIVFTLVHWPAWLHDGGLSSALSSSFPIFTTGLVLGFVFAQTRSLYVVVALHWLNNELSLLTF